MRRVLSLIIGVVVAATVCLVSAPTAHAADGVPDDRCLQTSSSLGRICVTASFDDTNCDRNSLRNCVGLNGARLRSVVISAQGQISTSHRPLKVDFYGGTTAYADQTYTLNYQPYLTDSMWIARPSDTFYTNISRICVRVTNANQSASYNIGGLNPYGLSQAGSCNLS